MTSLIANAVASDQRGVGKPTHPVASPDVPTDVQSIQTNAATKTQKDFRTYDDETPARVVEHYKDMRAHQTVEFYDRMAEKYSFEDGKYRCVR